VWSARLAHATEVREQILDPARYYDGLKPGMSRVDIWRTIYHHPLDGPEGIVEWNKSTGLKPFLDRLDNETQKAFLADYTRGIAEAYPRHPDGKVLLRFPRIFIIVIR
jgi:trans-aconitate 2-methyltransferase